MRVVKSPSNLVIYSFHNSEWLASGLKCLPGTSCWNVFKFVITQTILRTIVFKIDLDLFHLRYQGGDPRWSPKKHFMSHTHTQIDRISCRTFQVKKWYFMSTMELFLKILIFYQNFCNLQGWKPNFNPSCFFPFLRKGK